VLRPVLNNYKISNFDRWAKLFKATTWDELKSIVGDDEYMYEASKTLYEIGKLRRLLEENGINYPQ
jgi:hypothetical protein